MSTGFSQPGLSVREDFVTARIGGQFFGIPVGLIQDIFTIQRLTRVPLAPREVSGILNLRGRIVTAIDLRVRLGVPLGGPQAMAIGIEKRGEAFGLLVDEVGEVLSVETDRIEPNPVNLEARWRGISRGIYKLDQTLLVILDVERVLTFGVLGEAA